MTCPQLRAAFAAALAIGFTACARPASQPRVVGPVIGESTAPGPRDSSVPPPDPGGVTETSAPIHGTPSPVANPAITVDTMPSTLEPSGNRGSANTSAPAPVVVAPSGATPPPAATSPTTSTQAAGPNGPGTGTTVTPTAPVTTPPATTTPPQPTTPPAPTTPPQPTTPPAAPTTPAPAPSNGPGTGNTVNRAPPTTPAPTVTPR